MSSTLLAPDPDATQRDHPVRVVQSRAVTPIDQLLAEQRWTVAALDEMREKIGLELRAARERINYTVKKAALLAGVRPTEVAQIEHYRQYKKLHWRDDVATRLSQAYARLREAPTLMGTCEERYDRSMPPDARSRR